MISACTPRLPGSSHVAASTCTQWSGSAGDTPGGSKGADKVALETPSQLLTPPSSTGQRSSGGYPQWRPPQRQQEAGRRCRPPPARRAGQSQQLAGSRLQVCRPRQPRAAQRLCGGPGRSPGPENGSSVSRQGTAPPPARSAGCRAIGSPSGVRVNGARLSAPDGPATPLGGRMVAPTPGRQASDQQQENHLPLESGRPSPSPVRVRGSLGWISLRQGCGACPIIKQYPASNQ